MGALFSRNKNDGKKRTFKFWPSSHDQLNSTKAKVVNSPGNISKSQPISSQQWTEVTLSPPTNNILDNIEKDIVTDVPVPPPRKHKNKTHTVKPVLEKIVAEKSSNIQFSDGSTPTNLIPVEETLIIPKKEPIHICDGTHHHVRNIVNGKVIHDTIVKNKNNDTVQTEKHVPIIQHTPKKEERVIVRPKNLSTVSLPNFDELKIPKAKAHNSKVMKKPKRHISVVSLPTHNKTTLSEATLARLETYMARCKSFGSLPPKELLEKLQSQLDYSSDSEESWEGVDDWDMEIIEFTGIRQSPVIPRSRLPFPGITTTTTITKTHSADNNSDTNTISPISDSHHAIDDSYEPENVHTNETTHVTHSHSHAYGDIRVPTTIEEDEEIVKAVPQGIITLKKREGRRESIDDFFDSKGQNPLSKMVSIKPVNSLGRRGSDGFFGGDRPNLKDLQHKSSASYYSQSLLESETNHTQQLARRRQSAGAALHRIDSTEDNEDDENDDDQDIEYKITSTINEETISDSNDLHSKDSKRDSLNNDNDDFVVIHKDNPKAETLTTKTSETTEHSNLLKFLKTDMLNEPSTDVKEKK